MGKRVKKRERERGREREREREREMGSGSNQRIQHTTLGLSNGSITCGVLGALTMNGSSSIWERNVRHKSETRKAD